MENNYENNKELETFIYQNCDADISILFEIRSIYEDRFEKGIKHKVIMKELENLYAKKR